MSEIIEKMSLEDIHKIKIKMENEKILEKYTFPQKPSSDGYYHIYVKDLAKKSGRRAIKAKTLEALQEKLISHERGSLGEARKTFKDVFECVCQRKLNLAQGEKAISVKNTVNRMEQSYNRFFKETVFETLFIDEITENDIDLICTSNLTKYQLKKKAFDQLKGILKQCFEFALKKKYITVNPYIYIDFNEYKNSLIEETDISERAYSQSEVELILNSIRVQEIKYPYKTTSWASELQILMGTRIAEICSLTWDDVSDLYINIDKQQLLNDGDYTTVHHTKTYKKRQFPINNEIREYLKRLKEHHERYYPESIYLFPGEDANVITKKQVKDFFDYRVKSLKLQKKGLTLGLHSFRRNNISKALEKTSGNVILVSEIFGNSPLVVAKNYKLPSSLEEKRKAVDW